ncbi:hypothetical protein N658DRAFT_13257 [Parathielavia hyrcaniae]|uniref:Zn(2)-C6 fungal-type domain-containing protein n=1 Tax=Parathielavia hyrcaniae TaxID=113614 RepID=A0AAN6T5T9_9PEZI|nr:hypothetical protein N658DRAFT_13257 [Parathielavia hyrcaniae]
MVYCGKASQGCQSCRTRRIKCDKVRPQCTQCMRVRKQCPGYRDQLSLMFRDESTKVIQKAHAQWGVPETPESGELSSSSPVPPSSSSTSGRSSSVSEATMRLFTSSTAKGRRGAVGGEPLPKEISAPVADKAIQFYLEHYVLGLPDEPRAGQELQGARWVHSPKIRDIMAAVGLTGLSNLTGDKEMNTLSRHHYGLALRTMASSMGNIAGLDLELVLRSVVMMAMYEVTRCRDEAVSPARTHLMGAAAILNSFLLPMAPAEWTRGLLQLCFSMVASKQSSFQYLSPEPNVIIPTHFEPYCETTVPGSLPETFLGWISILDKTATEPDRPSVELLKVVTRFAALSALVRSQPLVDGHPKTSEVIQQALAINEHLEAWQAQQHRIWPVTEEHMADFFPPDAVFEGCYHVYDDTYLARLWNHYRWAHTLVHQLLLESADRFPASAAPLVLPAQRRRSLDSLRRLTRDTLVSIPTHYRHPKLRPEHLDCFDRTKPGAGIGIAGIPTLMFEVKVAGSAPGIPDRYRAWALGILETTYRDLGMFQAKALAGFLRRMVVEPGSMTSPSCSPSSVGGG